MVEQQEFYNPLQCPVCKEYRILFFRKVRFNSENKYVGYNLPFLKCQNCNKVEYKVPEDKIKEMAQEHLAKLPEGIYHIPIMGENKKFERYSDLDLKYDARDYYHIPGLYRDWDAGYLTPVFFDIKLLLSYNYDPDYRVYLNSFSTVSIYKGEDPLLFYGFGINRNGKLFTWLGDLYEFFSKAENKEHLYRFLSYNVESDHNIISNFYFMQIEARVKESDNERQIFKLMMEFGELIFRKFGFKIFDLDITQLRNEYKSPIINDKEQVFNAYKNLNTLLVENINKNELKKSLENLVPKKELKNLGSLKLLNKFFTFILKIENSDKLISPLFVLYDLRILDSHLSSLEGFEEDYNSCKERIGADFSINYIDFFKETVSSIINMFKKINEELEKL